MLAYRTTLRCAALAVGLIALSSAQRVADPSDSGPKGSDASTAKASAGELVFRSETAFMEVEVRVTDSKRRPVLGLSKDDFTLLENGVAQTIATLEYVAGPVEEAAIRWPSLPGPARRPKAAGATAARALPRRATRVFIASHVGPDEVTRVRKAVRKFIDEDLPAGVMVSLDGTAFSADKQYLLDLVDGRVSAPGLNGRVLRADLRSGTEFSRKDRLMLQEQGFGATKEGFVNMLQDQEGRSQVYRYVDMIRSLAGYPGKKIIVLFSRGLPLGYSQHQGKLGEEGLRNQRGVFVNMENGDLMRRLRGEAMRARIHFYVVDARGLEALDATSQSSHSTIGVEVRFATAAPSPAQRRAAGVLLRTLAPTAGLGEESFLSRQGLRMLAEQTGGKAVLNANDMGKVFRVMNEDLGGYYLLGYYPPKRPPNFFRKVKVKARRSGLKLSYRRGYYAEGELATFIEEQGTETRLRATGDSPSATTENTPSEALTAYESAMAAVGLSPADYSTALEELGSAVEIYPRFAMAWNLAGVVHSVQGQDDDARAAFAQAIETDAQYASPRRHLMRLEAKGNRWEEAEKAAAWVADFDPLSAEARYVLAVAQFNQEDLDAASETLQRAVTEDLASGYPDLLRLRGDILAAMEEFQAASESYREFLDAEPSSPLAGAMREKIETWSTTAKLQAVNQDARLGKWPEVAVGVAALLREKPDLTAARFFQALANFNLGDLDTARSQAQAIAGAGDAADFPQTHYLLGLIHAEQGDLAAAIEEHETFLRLRPESPVVEEVKESLGDWKSLL